MSVLTLLEVKVNPENVNDFKTYMKVLFPDTRAFKGCRGTQLQVNQDDETNMIAVEEWDTREAHQKYIAWRTETGVIDLIMAMLSERPSVRYFDKADA